MKLLNIFGPSPPRAEDAPEFIREVRDIRGVRVVRLRGPVGKEIAAQITEVNAASVRTEGLLSRSLLVDFSGTTSWDFSTVSYLVQALRLRIAQGAEVGIINAPPQLLAELGMAKLQTMFRVYATEEEALADLSRERPVPGSGA